MIKRNVLVTLTLLSLQPVAAHGATYTVTNTNDSGAGSLREAINDANSNAGTDTIAFNIAGAGVHTIFPSTPLPWLIGTTSVDGSTQPGFAGTPLIEIAGDFAGVGAVGLQIFNNSSQVGWLTINGFDSHGIRISGSGNATIVGCFIGVTNTGLASSFPNKGNGVFIDNSPNNNIGGTVASLRNIISANRLSGVRIEGASSTGNNVRGNYIGTNVNGTLELFNGPDGGGCGFEAGVAIIDAQNNTIGGPLSGYRNVISANRCDNIYISNGDGTLIQGNYVGLTASGSALVPLNPTNDTQRNIAVGSHNVTIGGTSVSHRNVIASANVGIILFGNNCTVQGNYIGTDATGSYALYTGIGVRIYGSDNNLIGGGVPGAGNVISGNAQGVSLIFDAGAGGMNRIQRNYIGLDASGLVAIPNIWGIIIDDTSSGNMIGGSLTSYRNFISGNSGHGISFGWLGGTATPSYNWVIGNYIGLDKNTQALGNGGSGIHFNVTAGAIGNKIGDSTIGGRNHIRYNGEAGISILTPATGTRISDNIIDDNFGLGIDLGGFGGVTPNDANDLDAGGNNQQNYPVFTSAVGDGQVWGSGTITVGGSLDSTPNTTFRIELYAIEACDSSGYGEGLGFLGFFDVTTNAGGDVTFSQLVINTRTFGLDWFLSATARNLTTDDTSEFSVCIPIGSDDCGPTAGTCYALGGNGTRGCETGDCCNTICDIDPYCCDVVWDDQCAIEAAQFCANGGNETSGDCFTNNGTPGCYSLPCTQTICEVDPYCCNTQWDQLCADQALTLCSPACPGDIPFVTPGIVDVEDLLLLLGSWGDTGPPRPRADLDPAPTGDNVVNVNDLLYLLASWGNCP